jgi:hypothetical protein
VKADGKKAPEGRQNTLPLFWVLQGCEREIIKLLPITKNSSNKIAKNENKVVPLQKFL